MANASSKVSDILENEWVDSILTAWNGVAVLVVAGLLLYFTKYIPAGGGQVASRIFCILALLVGLGIIILATVRGKRAAKTPSVPFQCPYCDAVNLFVTKPTEDFECDTCMRTVHFAYGEPVPVRKVICRFCRTTHKVSVMTTRYTCDRCNRLLDVSKDPTRDGAVAGAAPDDELAAMSQNYDVLLTAYDRRQENELAFKLQNLLVVTLPEARKHMASATPKTPLMVANNVPQRKADAIRRQLEELGATVVVRALAQDTRAR